MQCPEATFALICEEMSEGASLCAGLRKYKVSTTVFYNTVDSDVAHEKCYARARRMQAEAHNARITETIDRLLNDGDDIDANRARVAIDALKWTAARLHPAMYGDHSQLEVSGKDGSPLVISWKEASAPKPGATSKDT